MLQHYQLLTVTHRQTNLKQIGRFVLKAEGPNDVRERLQQLRTSFGLQELFYTATCNRVIYLFTTPATVDQDFIQRFFAHINPDLSAAELRDNVISHSGAPVIRHLYAVASSIDSLVIGERQILGQLREAYEQCQAWGLTGDDLRLLFQHMAPAAKDVYANTRIGEKSVSVVSLAVQKLLRMNLPRAARILLIGAGQTNALAAKLLHKHHYDKVTVFNRSLERAQQLAATFAAPAYSLEDLATYSEGFDVIFICTGATEPLLTAELYRQLLAGEHPVGKVIIDLAIPHNVAPEVTAQFEPVYIEIEGLRHLAQDNLAFREREVRRAEELLTVHVTEFPRLYKARQLEKAFGQIPSEIRAVRQRALDEVFRKEVEGLDEEARALLERVLGYMEKKCIGIPMKAAREALL